MTQKYLPMSMLASLLLASGVLAANYTVTTTNDTGPGSLRAVLTQANSVTGPHTVTFANSGHFSGGGSISLASSLPQIMQSVSLVGWRSAGATNNSIAVTGSPFMFAAGTSNSLQQLNIYGSVSNGSSIAITGCVISNGGIQSTGVLQVTSSSILSSPAAGIWSSGNSTLNGVTITGCSGGGIHNEGTMAIAHSLISSNNCSTDGGGIYSSNSLRVNNSQVTGNSSLTGRGGGLFNLGSLSMTLSSISSNVAYSGYGGGFYHKGSDFVLSQCTVAGNIARGPDSSSGGGGAGAFGGAIFCESTNCMLTNVTLSGNVSQAGNGSQGFGGVGAGLFGGSAGAGGSAAYYYANPWDNAWDQPQPRSAGSGGDGGNGGVGSGGGAAGGGGPACGDFFRANIYGCVVVAKSNPNYFPITWGCKTHDRSLGQANTAPPASKCPVYRDMRLPGLPGNTSNGNAGSGGYGGGGGNPNGAAGFGGGSATGTSSGGGAALGSSVYVQTGSLALVNCTVADNQANGGLPQGHGIGAIFNNSGTVSMFNTIVAANSSNTADGPDVYGTFTSLGHNFVGKTAGSSGWDILWDFQDAVPLSLGPLQDNGGPLLTHALLSDSLCIMAGNSSGAPATDARGVIRPLNKCDIGAYQYTTLVETTVTWTNPVAIVYGTPLSATQLSATASVGGTFSYFPPAGSVLNAGSNQILIAIFSPSDPTSYTGASNIVSITVLQSQQTITFPTIPPQTVNAPPILLNATASSGLPVSYSIISGDALLAGTLLSVGSTPGQVIVRASQAGNSNYLAALSVDQSFLAVVGSKPAILAQPTNQIVDLGGNASFSVSATTSPLTFQWQFQSLNMPAETNQSLSLMRVKATQAGPYRVIVSNPLGSITSVVAVLTVNVPPGVPGIVSHPANISARVGEAAIFDVVATGDATLHYQWYRGASGDEHGHDN